MGTLSPTQMFQHSLNVVKGPSFMHRLDKAAAPASGQTSINQGMLCSLDSTGAMIQGCVAGSTANRPMPMWAIQGVNDFDANSDVGNTSGGMMSAVVATGGYEIETTEYTAGSYNVNDLLTADTAGNLGNVVGATIAPYSTQHIVGVVSKPVFTNQDGYSVLSFWTVYLPAGSAVAGPTGPKGKTGARGPTGPRGPTG